MKSGSELTGAALDAAVAVAIGYEHLGAVGTGAAKQMNTSGDGRPWCWSGKNDWWRHPVEGWICGPCAGFPPPYSTDWADGGPLIESECVSLARVEDNRWIAVGRKNFVDEGPTPLIAAMRALIASKGIPK